jgi:hypothetical protein
MIPYIRVWSTLIMDTLKNLKEEVNRDTFKMQKWPYSPKWDNPLGILTTGIEEHLKAT